MRKTLVSLIALAAAGAMSASALAQDAAPATVTTTTTSSATTTAPADPAAPATTVVTPPATVVTTTPATPGAAPPPATVVTTTPATPGAAPTDAATTTTTTTATTVTTSAPPAEPVVEAPPPPPPPPTDPVTIQTLNVLENLCKPLVAGGDLQSLAKPMGFRKNRDNSWSLSLGKPYQITVLPQGVNKTVCNVEILHSIGGDTPITVGLHNYAISRGYTLYRNDEYTTDLKRHTRSWELTQDGQTQALVLVTEKNPDGSPVARNADRSTLMYSANPAAQ